MPRRLQNDPFQYNNDDIYPEVDRTEAAMNTGLQSQSGSLHVDAEEKRAGRSLQEMEKEAEWLKTFVAETNSS